MVKMGRRGMEGGREERKRRSEEEILWERVKRRTRREGGEGGRWVRKTGRG